MFYMPEQPAIKEFVKAFGGQWLTKMSGPLTVPFTLLALFAPQTWLKLLFAALAILCAFISAYTVWAKERASVCQLSSRLTPKLKATELLIQDSPNLDRSKSIWVQLVIKCLADVKVEECQGHLIRLLHKYEEKEGWEETDVNESLALGWSLGNFDPVTIHPGVPKRLNVFCVYSETKIMQPCVFPEPLRMWDVVTRFGKFRYEIRLTAKDCETVDVAVECELTKEWNKPKVSLVV